MKTVIILALSISAFACNPDKKEKTKALPTETVLTTGLIMVNLQTNEYATVALERTVKDTLMLTTVDSSGGKITQEKRLLRDTSYKAWWPFPVPDSTGKKPLKSKVNTTLDSTTFRFAPILKEIVMQDFNKNWKRN